MWFADSVLDVSHNISVRNERVSERKREFGDGEACSIIAP